MASCISPGLGAQALRSSSDSGMRWGGELKLLARIECFQFLFADQKVTKHEKIMSVLAMMAVMVPRSSEGGRTDHLILINDPRAHPCSCSSSQCRGQGRDGGSLFFGEGISNEGSCHDDEPRS